MGARAEALAKQFEGKVREATTLCGSALTGMPPMSVEQIVNGILINHIDEHVGNIRATIGGK